MSEKRTRKRSAKEPKPVTVDMVSTSRSSLEHIFTDGVLVDIDISYWSAKRRNTAQDLNIENTAMIPGYVIGLGTKRLIDNKQVLAWASIAMRAYGLLERFSYRFPVAGGRFVPAKALPEVEAKLGELKAEFDSVVADFLRNYNKHRAEMLDKYSDRRESLEGLYPPQADLARRFSFGWSVFNVSLPKSLKLKVLDRDKQAAYEARLDAQVKEFVDATVTILRAKVADVCGSLSERIARGEIITEPSLNKVRKLVDQFKMLNLAGDEKVEKILETLKTETLNGRSAAEFRSNEEAAKRLGETLASVASQAGDITDVSDISRQYRRRIELGEDN